MLVRRNQQTVCGRLGADNLPCNSVLKRRRQVPASCPEDGIYEVTLDAIRRVCRRSATMPKTDQRRRIVQDRLVSLG
jgi:hypothetical protein